MNLTEYLNRAVENLFRESLRSLFANARENEFLLRAAGAQQKAAAKRSESAKEGTPVPPFLIASIATQCNLHCAGCYARAFHACRDTAADGELDAAGWGALFREAADMGVSFVLLAGGEPLERPDVLARAAEVPQVIFPVFTNGTLFTESALGLFDRHRNLIPILSVEGGRELTDARRGNGVYDRVRQAVGELNRRGIPYGVSLTVTKANLPSVTGDAFIGAYRKNGCRLAMYVEYVPADGDAAPAPDAEDRRFLSGRLESLRQRQPGMLFFSFPGDEKEMGGCLAAGRGFFHINARGDAEACPFSPVSDTNIKDGGLRRALASPLFRRIRESGLGREEHTGGCALFGKKEEIDRLREPLSFPAPCNQNGKSSAR